MVLDISTCLSQQSSTNRSGQVKTQLTCHAARDQLVFIFNEAWAWLFQPDPSKNNTGHTAFHQATIKRTERLGQGGGWWVGGTNTPVTGWELPLYVSVTAPLCKVWGGTICLSDIFECVCVFLWVCVCGSGVSEVESKHMSLLSLSNVDAISGVNYSEVAQMVALPC